MQAAERTLADNSRALPADVLLLCGIPRQFHSIDLTQAAAVLTQLVCHVEALLSACPSAVGCLLSTLVEARLKSRVLLQDTMSCPMEGTYILNRVADEIVAAAHVARRASIERGDDSRVTRFGAVSSDDLLPLFIAAIVQVCMLISVHQDPLHGASYVVMLCLTSSEQQQEVLIFRRHLCI